MQIFVRNSAKIFGHVLDNANICPEYNSGKENIVRNSANNVWNSASFVWNTANFVWNMTKIPGHIPDVNLHCPECDQKSWHYSGQIFALSGI